MPFTLHSPYGPQYEIDQLLYVGRDPSCAIRPPDNLVSRVHACLWLDRGVVCVRDERSSNGTFVNGTRLLPGQVRTLASGDQVQFGETLFTLRGVAHADDFDTLLEPPVVGSEPPPYVAPPLPADYLMAPTERLPLGQAPPPPAQYAAPAAPAAPPPAARPRLSVPSLLLGGCAGVLTLILCGAVGFLLTPIGRQWLAGLLNGG
jgi:predicted component of type VI protein secretion system